MSGAGNKTEKNTKDDKQAYVDKLKHCLANYSKIIVVGADNVGSDQMQQIRQALRGKAEIIMGKNTLMKKALREHMECNSKIEPLVELVKNNVGLVFTDGNVYDVMQELVKHRVAVLATAGTIAPNDVIVPKGLTGLSPLRTEYFALLNIGTKIMKRQIEITTERTLIKAGEMVGTIEAILLERLGIKPFSYGLSLQYLYLDGSVGVAPLNALPHVLSEAYTNVLAVALQTDYALPQAEKIKEYLAEAANRIYEKASEECDCGDCDVDLFGDALWD